MHFYNESKYQQHLGLKQKTQQNHDSQSSQLRRNTSILILPKKLIQTGQWQLRLCRCVTGFLQQGLLSVSLKTQPVTPQSKGIWHIVLQHRALVPPGADLYFETI